MDENARATLTALSSVGDGSIVPLYADPTTHRLLVDTTGGSGLGKLTVTGTVNDSNISFVTSSAPTYMILNGLMYAAGDTAGGVVMWTAVGTAVTLAYPIGTGGSISAMG